MERSVRSGNRIDDVQVRRWLVERERSRRAAGRGGVPVVTISREYGARGAAVGRVVAHRLGFAFWDREPIDEHHDVHALIDRGRAVLMGRGLGFLIEASRGLRVRVVCPLAQRIAGLVEREGVSAETARATIDYADRSRRDFVQEVYGRDVDDVTGYDLWISTADLTVESAAAVIISAYRYRFGEQVMRVISAARG